MDFGSYLKRSRVAVNLSQREVADKMGYLTPQFISNWERGVSRPPITVVKKLSKVYNTDPQKLFEALREDYVRDVFDDLNMQYAKS